MLQLIGSKVPIRLLAVNGLLVALFSGGGCGPIVRAPRFPAQPESVQPGSPLGPFEGRVVDADTRRPVRGALVQCTWAFDRGVANRAPEAVRSRSTVTDVDGRYRLAALRSLPVGLSTRLARFSLVVYKKGYAAYRHDRRFGSGRRHRSFAQRGAEVRLARWSPEQSHARHLLFVGGGEDLRAASDWEVLAAAAELDSRDKRQRQQAPAAETEAESRQFALDASVLLSSDKVRAITGYLGQFRVTRLRGPRSETYDTFHLRAVDRPERYDVALRIWRLADAEAEQKYEELLAGLPGSTQNDEVGDRSFAARQGEILGFGLLDRARSAVVLLTCGRGQCSEEGHLIALARAVEENLHRLPALPGAASLLGGDAEDEEAGGEAPEGTAPAGPKPGEGDEEVQP